MRRIIDASTPELVEAARRLFLEYAASLDFDLCFQSFDEELASLPGAYAAPAGRLLVALGDEGPEGCVAVRPSGGGTCEMKRLYVRPSARGTGLGRALAERAIAEARAAGYTRMVLDTVGTTMSEAVALYRALGFAETEPYNDNPLPGVLHMALDLGGQ